MTLRRSPIIFLGLIALVCLSSCATMLHGSREVLYFNSYPTGATVYINGKEKGTTPLSIKKRRSYFPELVTMKKSGYETDTFKIKRKTIAYSSILSVGLIPIDLLSSAAIRYKQVYWERELKKQNGEPETYKKNIYEYPYVITNANDTIYVTGIQNTLRDAWTNFRLRDGSCTVTRADNKERIKMEDVKEARLISKQEVRWGWFWLWKKYSRQYYTYESGLKLPGHEGDDFYRICDYGNYKLMCYRESETTTSQNYAGNGKYNTVSTTSIYCDLYITDKQNKLVETISEKNFKSSLKKYFSDNTELMDMVDDYRNYNRFLLKLDIGSISRESIQDNRNKLKKERSKVS